MRDEGLALRDVGRRGRGGRMDAPGKEVQRGEESRGRRGEGERNKQSAEDGFRIEALHYQWSAGV